MAETVTSRDFLPYLHTAFRVEAPVAMELELAEVRDFSNSALEQFSLIFTGSASPWLPQGTYVLVHAQREEIALFLVPLGPRDGRMVYEAVLTRLAGPDAGGS